MSIETHEIRIKTRGNCEVVNFTEDVLRCVAEGNVTAGTVTVFVIGSTAGITTTEFEPGLATHDLEAFFEKIAPQNAFYKHEETWNDDNGHSHVRASLVGPDLTVPIVGGRLTLGTWQQIVLIDFDTRPRDRCIVVQIVGE